MGKWEAINASRGRQLVFFGGGLLQTLLAVSVAVALYQTHPGIAIGTAAVIILGWNVVSATLIRRWCHEEQADHPAQR